MRSSSKKKPDRQHSKYVQSRILISSNGVNPLSNQIASKLDLIKQQISRQFHEKFPTQKKRTTSVKKSSSSSKFKSESVKNVVKKLDFQPPTQRMPTEDTNQYREKYFDLNEKYLSERQKVVQMHENQRQIKDKINNFLEDPSKKTTQSLNTVLQSERAQKNMQKLISLNEDVVFAQNTLNEIMSIMQVQDIESLMNQLQNYPLKYKNLDECTYKIVQLQTNCNKTVEQYKKKLQQAQMMIEVKENQYKQQQKMQNYKKQQEFEELKRVLEKQNQNNINQIKHNLCMVIKEWSSLGMAQSQYELQHNVKELINTINQILIQMDSNLSIICNEAKENMQSLVNTKEDLHRMQKIMERLIDQTSQQKNKLHQDYTQLYTQSQQIKYELNDQLKKVKKQKGVLQNTNKELLEQNTKLKEVSINIQYNCKKKQGQFWKTVQQLRQLCTSNFLQQQNNNNHHHTFNSNNNSINNSGSMYGQDSLTKINKLSQVINHHIQELKDKLQQAQSFSQWHQKQLSVKEGLLREFDFNLKKMMQQNQRIAQNNKQLQLQRDQYKYLLSNIREQLIQTKKEYDNKIVSVIQSKDQEYLTSNKDILEANQKLNKQIKEMKTYIVQMQEQIKNEQASHSFYKKKTQQSDNMVSELRKKVIFAQNQTNKYQRLLNDIQSSLKEVQSISQINSMKVISLEDERKLTSTQLQHIKFKHNQLTTELNNKQEQYKHIAYLNEEYNKKIKQLQTAKEDVDYHNSELRIQNIEKEEQVRKAQDIVRQLRVQNNHIVKENHKYQREINQLTKQMYQKPNQKQYSIHKLKKEVKRKLQLNRMQICTLKEYIQQQKVNIIHLLSQTNNYLLNYNQSYSFGKSQQLLLQNEHEHEHEHEIMHCIKDQAYSKYYNEQASKHTHDNKDKQLEDSNNKINNTKLKLSYLRNDIESMNGFMHNTKEEIKYQGNVVREMMGKMVPVLEQEQLKLINTIQSLFKLRLLTSSLSNETQFIKEDLHTYKQTILSSLSTYLQESQSHIKNNKNAQILQKQLNQEQQVQQQQQKQQQQSQQQSQQLQDYLKKQEQQKVKKEDYNSPASLDHDKQEIYSPQFMRIKRTQSSFGKNMCDQANIISQENSINENQNNSQTQAISKEVNLILQALRDDVEFLKIPYFDKIKKNYLDLKKKLHIKNFNLDISAVSFKPQTYISSPTSVNLSKDFILEKRINTDPQQLIIKDSNRSQQQTNTSNIKKENLVLKNQVQQLQNMVYLNEEKLETMKIQMGQLQKQNTRLQNETSLKTIQRLFSRFLDGLFNEKLQVIENNCNILMKILCFSQNDIEEVKENFNKRKKKKNNFFSGIFSKN